MNHRLSLDNVAIVYLLWLFVCIINSTGMNAGITTVLQITILACAFILARTITDKAFILRLLAVAGTIQAIYAIFQQCGIAESSHDMFKITGLMGNPGQLGGFQSVSLISSLLLYRTQKGLIKKTMVMASSVLILYSLVLSDSRAGLLAAIGGIITMTHSRLCELTRQHKWTWIIILCMTGISIWLMYLHRSESVNARMFIWNVCVNMFVEKPLFGFGAYGFNHHYMLYQEKYLSLNPDSMYYHMATDVTYPYNEFIHILIEQGLVGFTLFIFMIFKALKECHEQNLCAPLVALLIFSMFSYPSYKLALCTMLPLLLGILPPKPQIYTTKAGTTMTILSSTIAILCILGVSYYECKMQKRISDFYNNPEAISDINTSFMQNHNNLSLNAQYATLAKHFPEILSDETIPLIFPSSENWCTIGNYYLMKENYAIAEKYFTQASGMTPRLISPKYNLWRTYLMQGKEDNATKTADEILHMKVKVENTYTLRIRNEIIRYKLNKLE